MHLFGANQVRGRNTNARCWQFYLGILSGLTAVSIVQPAGADLIYDGFASTAGLTINGNAATVSTSDGMVLRLTPSAAWQGGSAFSTARVSTAEFTSVFSFRITSPGGISDGKSNGADGLVFVVQNVGNNVGASGGGMGFAGLSPSLGVEFDTFRNPQFNDPSGSHVAIDRNGSVSHGASNGPDVNIDAPELGSGDRWWCWVIYGANTLNVYLLANESATEPAIPTTPRLTYNLNLDSLLGQSTAFVGFSAATGAAWENHDVLYWRYTESIFWTGDGDGLNWSDPTNWFPPEVPDASGERAIIDGADFPTPPTVRLDISPTIASLDLLNGATLEVLMATGSQQLTTSDGVVSTGLLRATDGQMFTIAGDIDQSGGGTIVSRDASRFSVANGTVTGGSVSVTSNGLLDLQGTATLDNVGITGLVVPDGDSVALDGTAINDDTMFVNATSANTAIEVLSDLTLAPRPGDTADLILGDQTFAFLGSPGAVLTNQAGHTIHGAGTILGSSLNNHHVIEAGPTALGGVDPETLTLASHTSNDGTLRATSRFDLDLLAPINQTAAGLIEAADADCIVTIGADVTGVGGLRASGGCGRSDERGCTPPVLKVLSAVSVAGSSLETLDHGTLELNGSAAVSVTGPITIDTEGRIFGNPPTTASISAGIMTINNTDGRGGGLELDDAMICDVAGDLALLDTGCGRGVRGCTPPVLSVLSSASLDMGGSLRLLGESDVRVESTQAVRLGGDFENHSTDPLNFEWHAGGLRLDGSAVQVFEVAGEDRGATTTGIVKNFAIEVVEISTNGDVICTNGVANTEGTAPCAEALYVRELLLEPGATLTLDNCKLYAWRVLNEGATVLAHGCGGLISLADYDLDGHIDLDDWIAMASCIDGPNVVPTGSACATLDLDGDVDADLADVGLFQASYSGVPPQYPGLVSAKSRKPNTAGEGGVCDLPVHIAGEVQDPESVASEPRQGGITELRLTFASSPTIFEASSISILWQTGCPPGSQAAYAPTALVPATVTAEGDVLVLTFVPALENASTYKIEFRAEPTGVPIADIEVRGLRGDADSDGRVNGEDRSAVVGVWTGTNFSCQTDLNNDGRTNGGDRSLVVGAWTTPNTNCAP